MNADVRPASVHGSLWQASRTSAACAMHRALQLAIPGPILDRGVAPFEGAVHRAHHRAARQRRFDLLDRAAAAAEPARRLAAGSHDDHRQVGVARLQRVRQVRRRPGVDRARHDGDVRFLFLRQRQRLVGAR